MGYMMNDIKNGMQILCSQDLELLGSSSIAKGDEMCQLHLWEVAESAKSEHIYLPSGTASTFIDIHPRVMNAYAPAKLGQECPKKPYL